MLCGRPVLLLILRLLASAALQAQGAGNGQATAKIPATRTAEQLPGYFFHHIDHTNGLLSDEVFSLVQDNRGYMWIGTGKGLQRYDGLRFRNYPDTSSAGMVNLAIGLIFSDDAHNRILYNPVAKSMREWKLLDHQPSRLQPADEWRPDRAVTYRDERGGKWLFQPYFNDDRKDPDTAKIAGITDAAAIGKSSGMALLQEPGREKPSFVFFIKDRAHRQTWISDHGLLLLDEENKSLSTPSGGGIHNALLQLVAANPGGVRNISMDSHGNIWVVTWSPLFYRYNTNSGKLYSYSVSDIIRKQGEQGRQGEHNPNTGLATTMMEDDHGRLWIGTAYAGLLEYHSGGDYFSYILHQRGNSLSLQYNDEIFGIFQDREENIWVGTDKGISIFNPYRSYFTTISNQQLYPGLAPGIEINCATQTAHGELLTGSWGSGMKIYDDQRKLKNSYFFKDVHDKNLIWSFMNNDDGSIWAGCQHGYLHLIDSTDKWVRTIHPPELENSTVRCLEKDRDGNMLLGLHNGKVVTRDRTSGQFLPFTGSSSVPLAPILNLFIDKQGRCWAGTGDGLAEFDQTTRSFRGIYKPTPNMPAPFYGIMEYNDSLLLACTGNAGLYFFNRRSKRFDRLPFRTDEPFWSAFAVRRDRESNIWFTTDYDLCKYNPKENKFLACHPGKGVISSSFAASHFIPLRSGRWLTWTNTEIVEFSPAEISAEQTAPATVTITGLKLFDKPVFIDSSLYMHQPIRLSYTENFISVEYSLMHFSGVSRTEYYYRMTGIDQGWVYAGARGYANYTNLPPGKYTFLVKTGGTGDEGDTASMDIIIVPPFWETVWFRIACLLTVAGLLYLLVRWRIRHVSHNADMQQQIATTEMMALRAQMNPHFIFNCINGIDALIQSNDKYQATVYLNKFARLIRNILDSSRQNSIPLTKDLETLRLYIELEQFRNSHNFTAEIDADEEIMRGDYKVPPLIIQPYVENAILHGLRNRPDNDGRLTIHIARQDGHLLYVIEDNGVGRQSSKRDQPGRRSYGMEMSSHRVKLFNRQEHAPVTVTDLQIDGEAAGTRVQVLLKIQ